MGATVDKAPWNEGYRRLYKKSLAKENLAWNKEQGYRQQGPLNVAVDYTKLTAANGQTYLVHKPQSEYFFAFVKDVEQESDVVDYIEKSFSNKSSLYETTPSGGHISSIVYSTRYQTMKVSFTNRGDVFVYFRVPKEIFFEFQHLSDTNTMTVGVDGTQRHAVGVRFWDYVRIRGTKTQVRYRNAQTNGVDGGVDGSMRDAYNEVAQPSETNESVPQADKPKIKADYKTEYNGYTVEDLNSIAKENNKRVNFSKYDALDGAQKKFKFLVSSGVLESNDGAEYAKDNKE